jgi:predicted nucleic acid-binding protein
MGVGSPTYVDADILVSVVVTKQPLYAKSVQLWGELLASNAVILISVLAVQEALWALARLSYADLFGHPSSTHWSKSIYLRNHQQIFQKFALRMEAIGKLLRSWSNAGAIIDVVPNEDSKLLDATDVAPKYMDQYKLAPSDATHLALAELHAKTLVTGDGDFKKVAQQATHTKLEVVHIRP